jgi:hypothetical protein
MQKKMAKVDNHLGQKVISYSLMNHVRGIIADGGAGYLLSDRLFFVPHKLNLSHTPVTVMLSDVEHISSYRIWGVFDTRLKIILKSGKKERFVIACNLYLEEFNSSTFDENKYDREYENQMTRYRNFEYEVRFLRKQRR